MFRSIRATLLGASLLLVAVLPANAAPITLKATVNTSALIALAPTFGPFSLDFQLSGTGGNTATISQFDFGGGSAVGLASTLGNATGSIASSVSLVSDGIALTNELFQEFTPGAFLSFVITLTTNVAVPTPDAFAFSILDKDFFNIPTSGPGDPLLLVDIDGTFFGPNDLRGFQGAGAFASIGANVTPVPEPSSLLLLGSGLVASIGWARRRVKALTGLMP